jgi:hypothetical protein
VIVELWVVVLRKKNAILPWIPDLIPQQGEIRPE